MKFFTTILSIFFILSFLIFFGCNSIKYPLTVEYFDAKWNVLSDSIGAEFFREIRYDDEGNPVGKITDYYINGAKQWEGEASSVNPMIKEGQSTRYYKSGAIKDIEYHENGLKNGIFSSYSENGELDVKRFYRKDTFLVAGYEDLDVFVNGKSKSELLIIKNSLVRAYRKELKNDFVEASKILNEVVKKYPEYSYPIERKAYFDYVSMEYKSAIEEYRKLATLDYPRKNDAKIQELISTFKIGEYSKTIKLANEIKANLDSSEVSNTYMAKLYGYQGVSYVHEGLPDIGEIALNKSSKFGDVPDVIYEFAKYHTSKSNYAVSNEILNYGITKYADFPPFRGLRSINHYKMGNYTQSRADHNYYLNISSKIFTDIDPELIVSIDLSNDLSRLGRDVFDAHHAINDQWNNFEREHPIISWGVKVSGNWFWNEIKKTGWN